MNMSLHSVVFVLVLAVFTAECCGPVRYSHKERKAILRHCLNREYQVAGIDKPVKPTVSGSYNITGTQDKMFHQEIYKCIQNSTPDISPWDKFFRVIDSLPLPMPFALVEELFDAFDEDDDDK